MGLLYQQTTATMLCDVPKMTFPDERQNHPFCVAFFYEMGVSVSSSLDCANLGILPQRFERTRQLPRPTEWLSTNLDKKGGLYFGHSSVYCGRLHGTIAIGTYDDGRRTFDLQCNIDVETGVCHEGMTVVHVRSHFSC